MFTESLFVKPSECSARGTFHYSWRAPGMAWLVVADDAHLFCCLPGFSVHIDLHDISSAGNGFGNLALMKADAVVSKRRQSNDFTKKRKKQKQTHTSPNYLQKHFFGGGDCF